MKQLISLKPVEMTKAVMQDLESKGLILRMSPDATPLNVKPGQTVCSVIHSSKDEYGPHKLMFVTVNRKELTEFGTHPDHEDFLMLFCKPLSSLFFYNELIIFKICINIGQVSRLTDIQR